MKTRNFSLFSLYFVIFMDNFGFAILFSILGPLILLPEYGVIGSGISEGMKNAILAISYGVFPLTQFFGAPIIGDIADHYGRKKALYITTLGVTIGYFLSALGVFYHSIALIIISRFLSGFFAGNLTVCLAAIADLSKDPTVRAKNFSNVTALFGISWVLSMVIGGYFSNPDFLKAGGPILGFLITGFLSLVNFFAIWFYFKESSTKKEHYRFTLLGGIKNIIHVAELKRVRLLFVAYLFWVVGWGISIQWFPPYSIEKYDVSVADITLWMIVLGIAWIVGSSLLNRWLLKKFNSLVIANIGIILLVLFILAAALIKQYILFALFYSMAALFSALAMSNIMNLISTGVAMNIQGKTMGLSQSMMALGWIIAAIIAVALNRHDIGFIYYLSAILLIVPVVILFGKFVRSSYTPSD
jgi:DHA1 family tetracycline resistance protein-like MFS transporter